MERFLHRMRHFSSLLAPALGLVGSFLNLPAFSQGLTPTKLLPANAVDANFGRSVAASDS